MTFKQFVENFNVDLAKMELFTSESKTYKDYDTGQDTMEPVVWVSFPKPFEGTQDYLVLSRSLANKWREQGDKALAECDAKLDPANGWGLICHSTAVNLKPAGSFTNLFG